jgi:5'-nucleotidase
MSVSIPLICFNDVYRVRQKYVPQPGAPRAPGGADKGGPAGEISVSQFGQLIYDIRDGWEVKQGEDGEEERQGLVLFAGDVFNPSVESSVTRGSHMVCRNNLSSSSLRWAELYRMRRTAE